MGKNKAGKPKLSLIKVKGFPRGTNLPIILQKLRELLPIAHYGKFWINEISDVGPNCREATVELCSRKKVWQAITDLKAAKFKYKGKLFSLRAYRDLASENDERQSLPREPRAEGDESQKSRVEGYQGNQDEYDYRTSVSPELQSDEGHTKSDFDIEMDLLRKQTEIIEQERKLLLKKKQLELLQEYGPDALKDLPNSSPKKQESPSRYDRRSYKDNVARFDSSPGAIEENPSGYDRESDNDHVTGFNNPHVARQGNPSHYRRENLPHHGRDSDNDAGFNDPINVRHRNPSRHGRDTYNDDVAGLNNPPVSRQRNSRQHGNETYIDDMTGFNNPHNVRQGDSSRGLDTIRVPQDPHVAKQGKPPHGRDTMRFPQEPPVSKQGNSPRGRDTLRVPQHFARERKPPHDRETICVPQDLHRNLPHNRDTIRKPQDPPVSRQGNLSRGRDSIIVPQDSHFPREGKPPHGRDAYNDNVTGINIQHVAGHVNQPHYGRDNYIDNVAGFNNPHNPPYGRETTTNPEDPHVVGRQGNPPQSRRDTYDDNVAEINVSHGARRRNPSHGRDTLRVSQDPPVFRQENLSRGRDTIIVPDPPVSRQGNSPQYGKDIYIDNVTGFNNPHVARQGKPPHYGRDNYNDNVTVFENSHGAGVNNPPRYDEESYVRGAYSDNVTGFNNQNNARQANPSHYGSENLSHYKSDTYNDNVTGTNYPDVARQAIPSRGMDTYNDNITGINIPYVMIQENPSHFSRENLPHYHKDTYNDNLTGTNIPHVAIQGNPLHYARDNDYVTGLNNPPVARQGNLTHYGRDNVTEFDNNGARIENPPRYDKQSYGDNVHGSENAHSYNDEFDVRGGSNNPNGSELDAPSRSKGYIYNDNIPGFENPHKRKRPKYDDDKSTPTWQPNFKETFPKPIKDPRPNPLNKTKPSLAILAKKLPYFANTSEIIINEMQNVIPKKKAKQEEKLFIKRTLNWTIRQRIKAALEGRNNQRVNLLKLYRSLYPENLDAKLVQKIRAEYKATKNPKGPLAKPDNGEHGAKNDNATRASNHIVTKQYMEPGNTASYSGNLNQNQYPQVIEPKPEQFDDFTKYEGYQSFDLDDDNKDWVECSFEKWK